MQKFLTSLCLGSIILLSAGPEVSATEFHVAPQGSSQGNGTAERPWDLATGLAATDKIQAGDTLWIHAGTYRGGYVSRLTGQPDSPIVVRGERSSRVIIDTQPRDEQDNALFMLLGSDTVYRDFEVTCSHPVRETKLPGSWPADIRRGGVDIRGQRISAINLVVHDCLCGFGLWSEGEGGEVSGCLIYNNGWRGPDRGHGHAIYAQNAKGTKRIVDNVLFHQFAYGVHVYGSEKASLKGFEITGNIAFENGCLTRKGDNAPGIMVGGATPAERIVIRDNVIVSGSLRLGYPWGTVSEDVVCTGNYCDQGLIVRDFRQGTISKNTVVAHSNVVQLQGAERLLLAGLKWDENDYYMTDGQWGQCAVVEASQSRGLTFDEWREVTGFDRKSRFTKGSPAKLEIVVRPNAYEPGRANLAILNPASLPTVDVDLSAVLKAGQKYRVVSVKDFFGPAIVSGVFESKPVKIPMKPVKGVQPVGMPEAELPVTEPNFAAFVVLAD